MDLALDPETGDFLHKNGELQFVDGAEEVAQNIRLNLESNYGEWEFGTDEGLRWEQVIGHRGEDLSGPGAELKRCILAGAPEGTLSRFETRQEEEVLVFAFEVDLGELGVVAGEGTMSEEEFDLLVWVV